MYHVLSGCVNAAARVQQCYILDTGARVCFNAVMVVEPWYILRVNSLKSRLIEHDLWKRGCEAYVPRVTVSKAHRRYKAKVECCVDMFPGYVFFRTALLGWREVRKIDGVRGVLRTADESFVPATISPESIEAIDMLAQAMSKAHGSEDNIPVGFKVGQRVLLANGPLRGFRGVVVSQQGNSLRVESSDHPGRVLTLPLEMAQAA